jgi:hypothetical protein
MREWVHAIITSLPPIVLTAIAFWREEKTELKPWLVGVTILSLFVAGFNVFRSFQKDKAHATSEDIKKLKGCLCVLHAIIKLKFGLDNVEFDKKKLRITIYGVNKEKEELEQLLPIVGYSGGPQRDAVLRRGDAHERNLASR